MWKLDEGGTETRQVTALLLSVVHKNEIKMHLHAGYELLTQQG